MNTLERPVHAPRRITFSTAAPEDGEALAELRVAAMRESLERIGRFDPARARERFLHAFVPSHTRHIEVDGERVGFLVVRRHEQGLFLDHLYLRPGYQGQGTGAAVLAHVLAEGDAAGMAVHVGALRESDSNRFYLRHGFLLVEKQEHDNLYVRPATVQATA